MTKYTHDVFFLWQTFGIHQGWKLYRQVIKVTIYTERHWLDLWLHPTLVQLVFLTAINKYFNFKPHCFILVLILWTNLHHVGITFIKCIDLGVNTGSLYLRACKSSLSSFWNNMVNFCFIKCDNRIVASENTKWLVRKIAERQNILVTFLLYLYNFCDKQIQTFHS